VPAAELPRTGRCPRRSDRFLSGERLKEWPVTPIPRNMKALDRPLVRPLLIVLLAALAWTIWATDFGVHL
jgi:hypothetical protein